MSIFDFAHNNPIIAFCTVYILALAVTGVVKNLLRFLSICINRHHIATHWAKRSTKTRSTTMTNYQRDHYHYDFSQPTWLYALFVLGLLALFIGAQLLDDKDSTDELRDIAADKTEIVQSARQHAVDLRVAADARLAAVEYAREEKLQ